ncbi:MAG: response regulator transcription factor [Bacteroidota bacterium]
MGIRIAIVDDKRLMRTTLSEQLSYYEELDVMLMACDGNDFLTQMNTLPTDKRPELVLMDIEMPNLDGIETVAITKEIYPDVLCLMLTVFDNDEKLFEAIRAGASGYLLKDEKPGVILKAITESIYDGGVPMSPRIAQKALMLLRRTSLPVEEPTVADQQLDSVLSDREIEILQRIVDGLNYQQIGERLFISPHTVRKHTANIYNKLHVSNKASAIKVAMHKKWFK